MDVTLPKGLASACIFLLFANVGNAQPITVFVAGGPNFSNLKNNSLVAINATLSNAYLARDQAQWQGFGGFGANYRFNTPNLPAYQLSLGLAGYFFQLAQVQGIEYPFINAGLFDSLNYGFHAKSASLMVEAKAVYTPHALQPYAVLGIGPAWNKLSAYHEQASNFSSSAAPAQPFSNHSQTVFSYELGAGLQYLLKEDPKHHVRYYGSAGYQYFNLDKATLGPSAAQTTADRIKIKNLYTQGVIFTLAASFA